ncbi:MAG: cation:proton antiporter, partial [Cyclobacteriaceae bacterium]|nr:cation:proton antiporter [Cyclobacteriaceae bacterium]
MDSVIQFLVVLGSFAVVSIAARFLARYFKRVKLPLITGLLFVGILCGPFVLGLVPASAKEQLGFISDIALAYIAFAAGSELYLKELRDRLKSIKWITISQVVFTFIFSGLSVFFLIDYIPLLQELTSSQKLVVSILTGVIFMALSPASAIAIINEVRAKGPFTYTALGVTVLTDFIVIIMFSVVMTISVSLVHGQDINLFGILIVLLEVGVSFGLGFLLARILSYILMFRMAVRWKTFFVLFSGYFFYLLFYVIRYYSLRWFGKEFLIEPILICIIGSFLITNYSKYRHEFIKILKDTGPLVYIIFFTLAGSILSLDVLAKVWVGTLAFFTVRLISLMVGSYVGGRLANDPPLFNRLGWMPYITQAGVGLGLTLIVARTFPDWGFEFATVIISVIVVSQIVGPPLFKLALAKVKESHPKADTPEFDGVRDAIIFGLENQSIALARQLMENNWEVKIATFQQDVDPVDYPGIHVTRINDLSVEMLESLDAGHSEAAVLMLTDEENLILCDLIYEHIGIKDVVVRLNQRYNFQKFHEMGALVVDPSTAIVSLLDHFVRSPQAASLLLGMQKDQDSMDVEVMNANLHGIPLRDLRLPPDIIILSIIRGGQ